MSKLCSQEPGYRVDHYSVDKGLSDHRVGSILQHSSGFVFVGTISGLDRFDGQRFTPVPLQNDGEEERSIVSVLHLAELTNGTIAIFLNEVSTEIVDVVTLDPGSGAVHFRERVRRGMSDFEYILDQDTLQVPGGMWSGYHQDIVDAYGNTLQLQHSRENPGARAMLRFATGDSLDLSAAFRPFKSLIRVSSTNLSEYILVSSWHGLFKITITQPLFRSILSSDIQGWEYPLSVRSITQVGDRLLLSTTSQGTFSFNLNSGESVPLEVTESHNNAPYALNWVCGFYPEDDSVIWLSSYYRPLASLHLPSGVLTSYMSGSLVHANHGIRCRDGSILVSGSTRANGEAFIRYDPANGQGDLILHSDIDGLFRDHPCMYLYEAGDDRIWCGSSAGLFLVDMRAKKMISAYVGDDARHLFQQASFPVHRTLSASSVMVIVATGDTLWVGTHGGGLNILDLKSGNVSVMKIENGLTDNRVCGLVPDSAGMWIATYRGLSYYAYQDGFCRNFYTKHGLPHDEFNRWSQFVSRDGRIYMGGMNGVTEIDPEAWRIWAPNTSLLFSEAGYYDRDGSTRIVKRFGLDDDFEIRIPSRNRSVYLRVALTDFRDPDGHTYMFRLRPLNRFSRVDEHWRNNGRSSEIRLEYLPAGRYELYVSGISAQSARTREELVVRLRVREFFFRTWWFIALCAAVLLGLTYGAYRYRLAQMIRMERLRTRLSSDLHDDVGGLLSGVAYQMELLGRTVDDRHKALVRRIVESSRKAMIQMRDVVWAIDVRQSSFRNLIERMDEYAREILPPLDIHYSVVTERIDPDKAVPSEIRHALVLIFKEFVTNSVKHAEASSITAVLRKTGKSYEFHLQDNGKGIGSIPEEYTGQGLVNMQSRVEKIGGTMEFTSGPGFGVVIRFPGF